MKDKFEATREMIDVTSMNRPDTSWCHVDEAGHEHRWYVGDVPAEIYQPGDTHHLPTLHWVVDGIGYYPDGSEYEQGYYECRKCRHLVTPRCTADSYRQHIPGPMSYWINDEPVTREEYEQRLKAAQLAAP